MASSVTVEDNFDLFAARIDGALKDSADEAAVQIAFDASAGSEVLTGGLQNSWYVVTPRRDTYDDRVAEASALKPDIIITDKEMPDRPTGATAGSCAMHAYVREFGLGPDGRANPTFQRAYNRARRDFPGITSRRVRAAISMPGRGTAEMERTP